MLNACQTRVALNLSLVCTVFHLVEDEVLLGECNCLYLKVVVVTLCCLLIMVLSVLVYCLCIVN